MNLAARQKKLNKLLGNPVIKSVIFGRTVFIFLLAAAQLFLIFYVGVRLQQYLPFYLSGSLILSILFTIYLINCKGKNEFKIAWLLPVLLFPPFGIILYIIFHIGYRTRKNLAEIRHDILPFMQKEKNISELPAAYSETQDLANYLYSEGLFLPYINSSVKYYPNGESLVPDLRESLKKAQKFIFIESFIISPGSFWDEIMKILYSKVRSGVEVRVMYDGFGSMSLSPKAYKKYLVSLGIDTQVFMPLIPLLFTQQNNRNHRKIIVIDGIESFTGGINLADEYINKNSRLGYWKDTSLKIEGAATKSFTALFLQTWILNSGKHEDYERYFEPSEICPAKNTPGVLIPYGDDAFNNEDIAENVYLYIINKAKQFVHITTPYIILDNQLLNALIFAARRHVDVTLLVPARADHYITYCIGRTFIKTLIDNGVHVYEYVPGFIHAKMFISDNERAVVGSINLDYRSLFYHFESATYMYGNSIVDEIENDFLKTKIMCREITPFMYKKSPAVQRIIGRVFRIFAPLV